MIIFMKTARLFITLLVGATILLSGCNNDDDPVTYTVTVTQDANGTAEADKATAEAGTIVKLTATAADGYNPFAGCRDKSRNFHDACGRGQR